MTTNLNTTEKHEFKENLPDEFCGVCGTEITEPFELHTLQCEHCVNTAEE